MASVRILATVLGFFALQQSQAQTPGGAGTDSLEEIVVKGVSRPFKPEDSSAATKIAMKVVDTPQSMTILSRELMDMASVSSIEELVNLAPNTQKGSPDISGVIFFNVRGFGAHSGTNAVNEGLKINGLGIDRYVALDTDFVERAEIVRGPSSVLYGQSDYGSVLNMILKRPRSDAAVTAKLQGDTHGSYKGLVDVTGSIAENHRLTGRFVGSYGVRKTGEDLAYSRSPNLYGALQYIYGDDSTLDVQAFHSYRDMRTHYGYPLSRDSVTGEYGLPPINKSTFGSSFESNNLSETNWAYFGVTHRFSDEWSLTLRSSFADVYFNWHEPYIFANISDTGERRWFLNDYNQFIEEEWIGVNATLNGKFELLGGNHEFMFDLLHRDREKKDDFFQSVFSSGTPEERALGIFVPPNPDYYGFLPSRNNFATEPDPVRKLETSDDLSIGALLLLHPIEHLTVMIGGRWTEYEYLENYRLRPAIGQFDYGVRRFDDSKFVSRYGVVYSVRENFNIYGSWSQGIAWQDDRDQAGALLGPEDGTQWEFGAKAEFFDSRLLGSIAYFDIERSNIAAGIPGCVGCDYSRAIGGQTHSGVELEVIGEPMLGWNLYAAYSYLDVSIEESNIPAEIGNLRYNTPKHQIKLFTEYEVSEGPLAHFSFGAGVLYASEREVNNIGSFQFPAYTQIDFSAGYYGFEHVSILLQVRNLTDEEIWASHGNWTEGGNVLLDRRALIGTVTFHF